MAACWGMDTCLQNQKLILEEALFFVCIMKYIPLQIHTPKLHLKKRYC